MTAIAKQQGIKPTTLLTKKATRAAVLAEMRKAAKLLAAGDLFFLSYSGHGGQVPDVNGEEDDKKDETWCLYDGQLIDDELYFELGRFERRRAHPRPLRQLPQRHGDARSDHAAGDDPEPAAEADARGGRDAHLPRAPGVLRQAAEGRRRARPASPSSIPTPRSPRSR